MKTIRESITFGEALERIAAAGQTTGVQVTVPSPAGRTEAAFQQRVIDAAQHRGWLVAHFRAVRVQRADGTTHWETPAAADGAGFPDLVLARGTKAKDRVMFVELKSETGRVRPDQRAWHKTLACAGAAVFVWRPADWPTILTTLE